MEGLFGRTWISPHVALVEDLLCDTSRSPRTGGAVTRRMHVIKETWTGTPHAVDFSIKPGDRSMRIRGKCASPEEVRHSSWSEMKHGSTTCSDAFLRRVYVATELAVRPVSTCGYLPIVVV
jgi:hypothetical protein